MPGNVRKNPEIPRGQVPGFFSARFTKPVQPIIYQPEERSSKSGTPTYGDSLALYNASVQTNNLFKTKGLSRRNDEEV